MSTSFRLNDEARLTQVATQLERSKTALDDPSRFAIVTTKTGNFVVAGADAPNRPGAADIMTNAAGSGEQQRIIGNVYQVINAQLFSMAGKASIAASSACEAGAVAALLSGNWKLGLVLAVVGAWAAVPAGGEYSRRVLDGLAARQSLKASGVDLAKVEPPQDLSFAEIVARSSVPF